MIAPLILLLFAQQTLLLAQQTPVSPEAPTSTPAQIPAQGQPAAFRQADGGSRPGVDVCSRQQRPEVVPDVAAALAVRDPRLVGEVDETPVTTQHSINLDGKTINYTATVAQMPLKTVSGETEAHIFYVAYTLNGVNRPG